MAPAGGGPSTPVSVVAGSLKKEDCLPVPLVGAASRPILAEPSGPGQRTEGAGPRGAVLVRGHPRQHEDYLLARRDGELARGEGPPGKPHGAAGSASMPLCQADNSSGAEGVGMGVCM